MLFFSRYFISRKTFTSKCLELEKKIKDLEKDGKKINNLENNIKKINELEIKIKKLKDLEGEINKLKELATAKQMNSGKPENPETNKRQEGFPGIIIEHLQVDQITIEHLDYANNFGQLGIRELSGKLNIGTSYEGDFSKEIEEKVAQKLGNIAKVNVKARKEE